MSNTARTPHATSTRRGTYLRLSSLLLLCAAGTLALGVSAPVGQEVDSTKAAQGAGAFRLYCGSCHGAQAEGDGELADLLSPRPANLSEIAKRNDGKFDYERVKATIDGRSRVKAHGNSQMPVWGDAFLPADGGNTEADVAARIEKLTHFVWSLQK